MKAKKGKKVSTPQPQTTTIDWSEVHCRLETARGALERGWAPSVSEKKKILRERAIIIAQEEEEETAGEVIEIVEFLLSSEKYGIESSYVREVHSLKNLTPLPCTPSYLLGVVNVHGQIIPVIDIRKLFGLPEQGLTDINNIVIVSNYEITIAILTDAIVGMCTIPLQDIQPSLPTLTGIHAEYLRGVTKERLAILDVLRILSDKTITVHEEIKQMKADSSNNKVKRSTGKKLRKKVKQ